MEFIFKNGEIVYISEDGHEFRDPTECVKHEVTLKYGKNKYNCTHNWVFYTRDPREHLNIKNNPHVMGYHCTVCGTKKNEVSCTIDLTHILKDLKKSPNIDDQEIMGMIYDFILMLKEDNIVNTPNILNKSENRTLFERVVEWVKKTL